MQRRRRLRIAGRRITGARRPGGDRLSGSDRPGRRRRRRGPGQPRPGRGRRVRVVVRGGRTAARLAQHRRNRARRAEEGSRRRRRLHLRHTGQRHRPGHRGPAPAARTPTAARSRRTSSTARPTPSGWRSRRTGWANSTCRAGRGRDVRADLRQRRRRARPARLDAPGLRGRQGLDDPGHPRRARPSTKRFQTKAYDVDERPRPTGTTGWTSPATAARRHSSSPTPALRRRHRPARRPATCAARSTRGPSSSPTAKARRGLHRPQALRYAGTHKADGRGVLVQQGLRRRHRPSPGDTELSYRVFPSMAETRPGLPRHLRRASTWPSPTAPT